LDQTYRISMQTAMDAKNATHAMLHLRVD